MKSVLAIAVATASVAVAQLENLPQCALSCFVTALSGSDCDSLTDFECQCAQPGLQAAIQPCLDEECDEAEVLDILQSVQGTCADAGVEIELTTPAGLGGGDEPTPADDEDLVEETDAVVAEDTVTEVEVVETTATEEVTDTATVPLIQSTDAAAHGTAVGSFVGAAAALLAIVGV